MESRRNSLGALAVLGAAGIGLSTLGAHFYKQTQDHLQVSERVQGTVIRIERVSTPGDQEASYRPVVRFVTAKGETIEFSPSWSSGLFGYSKGETVGVYYDPATHEARLDSFIDLWLAPFISGSLGGLLLLQVLFALPHLSEHHGPRP